MSDNRIDVLKDRLRELGFGDVADYWGFAVEAVKAREHVWSGLEAPAASHADAIYCSACDAASFEAHFVKCPLLPVLATKPGFEGEEWDRAEREALREQERRQRRANQPNNAINAQWLNDLFREMYSSLERSGWRDPSGIRVGGIRVERSPFLRNGEAVVLQRGSDLVDAMRFSLLSMPQPGPNPLLQGLADWVPTGRGEFFNLPPAPQPATVDAHEARTGSGQQGQAGGESPGRREPEGDDS